MVSRYLWKDKYFIDLELLVLFRTKGWKSLLLQGGDHGVRKFFGAGFAADVPGCVICLAVDLFEGFLDSLRRGPFAEVVEHQNAAHQQGSGISESLAGDIRGGTVNSLEHGAFVPDVGAGHHAQAADQPRRQIAHDVAVKIRQQKHVKLLRIHHNLHAGVVDDEFFVLDAGELRGDGADRSQKKTVGKLHDVGFVNGMNLFSAVACCIGKRESCDARGGPLGNDLEAFHNAGDDLVLEAGIQILGVFPHEDEVHVFEVRFNTRHVFDRSQIGVKVERFTQRHVHAGCAASDGRSHRALQRNAIPAHGFDGQLVDACSLVGGIGSAPANLFPIELHPSGFQDAARRGGYFRANSFAGDKGNFVSNHCIQLYAKRLSLSKCGDTRRFMTGTWACAAAWKFWYNVKVDSFAGAPASGGQEDL